MRLSFNNFEVSDFRLHFQKKIRVEIIIFGPGQILPGKAADCRQSVPEGEHLDMNDVALPPVQAPGSAVALRGSIVGKADLCHQGQIFRCLGSRNAAMPTSCNHDLI